MRILEPKPFKEFYNTLWSDLPETQRLRMDYLVSAMYTRELRSQEWRQLPDFTALATGLSHHTPAVGHRQTRPRERHTAVVDIEE